MASDAVTLSREEVRAALAAFSDLPISDAEKLRRFARDVVARQCEVCGATRARPRYVDGVYVDMCGDCNEATHG